MATVAPLQRVKSTRLGKANWTDPERRQSIKDDTRVKMEWRFKPPFRNMKCWVPLQPARPCLMEAMEKVEKLLQERNHDVWDGENTSPGCSYDAAMYGRSMKDAQPAVIFCSPSKICRRNAENIITNEDIAVDPRGIGMEYYSSGPDFFASNTYDIDLERGDVRSGSLPDLLTDLPSSSKRSFKSSSSSNRSTPGREGRSRPQSAACMVNGSLIFVQSTSCTMGGVISIGGELYGLTVAHAFEREGILNNHVDPAPAPTIRQPNMGTIGSLLEKRRVPAVEGESLRDLDWAVCLLDRAKVHLTNNISLPDGATLYSTKIALQDPSDADVWVHTGTTGLVKGFLTGVYSLVALPGSRTFQRMWVVVLDRLIYKFSSPAGPGDCGSWVIDSTNGILYGHIVAAKPETAVAYIVLARDIFKDIQDQFGGRQVRMPIESDFVDEAVSIVKRELSQSSSTAQGSSQQDFMHFSVSSKGKRKATIPGKTRKSSIRRFQLMPSRFTGSNQKGLPTSIMMHSLAHISARESFLQILYQDAAETRWYARYLETCFREHFEQYLLPTLPGLDQSKLDALSIGPENMGVVYRFLAALAQHILTFERGYAICEIVDHFTNIDYINVQTLNEDDDRMNANRLILIAIGWLTMSMPHPISYLSDGVKSESEEVFINQQALKESSDYPISSLLRRFKIFDSRLDPPPLYQAYGQAQTSQYFMISTICYNTLREVARIEIIWTKQLPLHLNFDRKRRTLTLFAFPSFARMQFSRNSNTILAKVLRDFFAEDSSYGGILMPTGPSVEDLCREILLSYRLIFGLDSSSRRLFNRESDVMRPWSDFDPFLSILCGEKWDSPLSKAVYEEIDADPPASFYLTSDFPLFGHKLFELHDFVQRQHPNSWRALWHDRRNTTQWWTFWAVSIFGVTTIFISTVQLVLQIWEVAMAQN